jgi:hypothetical protein
MRSVCLCALCANPHCPSMHSAHRRLRQPAYCSPLACLLPAFCASDSCSATFCWALRMASAPVLLEATSLSVRLCAAGGDGLSGCVARDAVKSACLSPCASPVRARRCLAAGLGSRAPGLGFGAGGAEPAPSTAFGGESAYDSYRQARSGAYHTTISKAIATAPR